MQNFRESENIDFSRLAEDTEVPQTSINLENFLLFWKICASVSYCLWGVVDYLEI